MVNVSIITPCYKGSKYLPVAFSAIKSNLNYARKHIKDFSMEWIIVNDSPEDGVIEFNYENFEMVKIVNHDKNKGIHQARVTGLSVSTGQYIIFLDQDDVLAKECVFESFMAIKNADLLIENAWIELGNGNKELLYSSKGAFINALSIMPYLTAHNQITSPGHCLIKRTSIPEEWERNILSINGSDDLYLWLLMLGNRDKIVFLDKAFYTHKYTGVNLSDSSEKMARSSIQITEYLKKSKLFSQYQISCFERTRKLKLNNNFIRLLCNFDILFYKVLWKLREKIVQ